CFSCFTVIHEAGYDERTYRMMKEALTHIAETNRGNYMKLHAKALVETTERLESRIKLIVNFISIVIPSRLTYTTLTTIRSDLRSHLGSRDPWIT
ncbi:MAG: hypothetical protein QXQ29_05235, partial [Candidatus Bathyarchaeia archaeon]